MEKDTTEPIAAFDLEKICQDIWNLIVFRCHLKDGTLSISVYITLQSVSKSIREKLQSTSFCRISWNASDGISYRDLIRRKAEELYWKKFSNNDLVNWLESEKIIDQSLMEYHGGKQYHISDTCSNFLIVKDIPQYLKIFPEYIKINVKYQGLRGSSNDQYNLSSHISSVYFPNTSSYAKVKEVEFVVHHYYQKNYVYFKTHDVLFPTCQFMLIKYPRIEIIKIVHQIYSNFILLMTITVHVDPRAKSVIFYSMHKEDDFENFNWSINLVESFGSISASALKEIIISGGKQRWAIPSLYCLRNILFHSGSNFKGSLSVMKVDLELDVDEAEFNSWVLAKID